MKLIKKYSNEYSEYKMCNGEICTLQQSDDATKSWGFTSDSGYNSWEGNPYDTRKEAFSAMKGYNSNLELELKYA